MEFLMLTALSACVGLAWLKPEKENLAFFLFSSRPWHLRRDVSHCLYGLFCASGRDLRRECDAEEIFRKRKELQSAHCH